VRVILMMAATIVLMLTGSASAWAHASLTGTDPADGTLLAAAPSTVTLTFSEPVRVDDGGVRLLTAAGDELPSTAVAVDNRVVITPAAPLGTGTVIVSWQVISADSHPISGGFTFAVGERTAGAAAVPTVGQDAWVQLATAAAQALAYLGVLAACGLVAFDVLLLRERGDAGVGRLIRRTAAWSAGAGVVGVLLLLPLTEVRQRFGRLGDLLDPGSWTAQIGQDAGLSLVLVGAGLLLAWEAAWAVNQRTVGSAGAALAGCGVALGSFAVTGHTRGYGPAAVVLTADLLHLTVAACWLGGLIGVGLLLSATGRPPAERPTAGKRGGAGTATRARSREQIELVASVLARFSTLAAVLLVLLAISGVLMALRILGSWDALLGTGYGQALLIKLLIVAAAVALAGYNRYRLLPAVVATASWLRLRRTLTAEAALLVAVLLVTGALVNASPTVDPATAASEPAQGGAVERTAALGSDTVTARITPGAAGINSLEITLTDATGQPLRPLADPQVSVTMPAAGVGPLTRPVAATGPGAYQAVLDLPLTGQWVITISVRTSEFEQPSTQIQVEIP
jgi:copper transport protein